MSRKSGPSESRDATGWSGSAASKLSYSTKTELVYAELRSMIVEGKYRPGDRVILDEVARQFGVSKVPVREAVVKLASEGLLQTSPHIGPVVPEVRPNEAEETSVIRSSLESVAAREAVSFHTLESIERLNRLASSMEKAMDESPESYAQLNYSFHSELIDACPYSELKQMCRSLLERTLRHQPLRQEPEMMRRAQLEHSALVSAIAAGDSDGTERLVKEHILSAGLHLRDQLAANVDGRHPSL